jgi:L-lactate dehydrogenase complex protein LldE
MIRKEYAHLLADDPAWRERAVVLAGKTFELSEFLSERVELKRDEEKDSFSVTYHDSCHMCRSLGIKDQPRNLIRQVGCQLEEMEESDRCCGFGGVFSARVPEVSQAMTEEKLAQAHNTRTDILVTADPGCLMQMREMLGEEENLRILHLAEFLEEVTR